MSRIASFFAVGLLAATACSAGEGVGRVDLADVDLDSGAAVDDDPVAQLCVRWPEFEALMESDAEPTDELISEVLERQRGIEEVLPDELSAAWAGVTGWNNPLIEYFSAAGYQDIDDETLIAVFGGEQSAATAVDAMEAGFTTMQEWRARNCTTGEGDARTFCAAWTDISSLLVRLDEEPPTEERVDELLAAYTETAPAVPTDVRDDWKALFAFEIPFRDVLVTVEYDLDRVSDELLAEAFGSLDEFEVLQRAADAGRASIDTWSLDGCGGFCSRWGETREAIDSLGHDLGWVIDMGDEGRRQLQAMQARIDLAARQIPDELDADWELLMVVLDDWYDWWESLGFDQQRVYGPDGRDVAAEIALSAAYFPEIAFEMFDPSDGRGAFIDSLPSWSDDELAGAWQGTIEYAVRTRTERIDGWVDEHCDVEGGLPGRLRVTWPMIEGEAGSMIVLAVMPAGATIDDLGNIEAREAGYCEAVSSDPWGYDLDPDGNRHRFSTDWFRSEWVEGREESLCDFAWEAGPGVLDAGPHTLLAALVPGGVPGRTLPAPPTACVALDINVDGDTEIELPPLPECDADLADLVVDTGTWQTPEPVDPARPGAGTLRVTVPSLVLPEGIEGEYGGEFSIVVLPSGTTLNEVGREQVWPSGGFRGYIEPTDSPNFDQLVRLGAVDLPIMEVPPNGEFGFLDPHWLSEAPVGQLPLVVLAPGDYDVHVQLSGHSEGGEDRRCGRTTVTIDGDTIVEMPDLGECP